MELFVRGLAIGAGIAGGILGFCLVLMVGGSIIGAVAELIDRVTEDKHE